MQPFAKNLALVVVSFLGSPLCARTLGLKGAVPNLPFLVFIPAFLVVGIISLCFMLYVSDEDKSRWVKPGLHKNSFVAFSQRPLQVFWINGHVMAAMTLGSIVSGLFTKEWGWEWVFFACVACGCYIGVYLAMLLFKNKKE